MEFMSNWIAKISSNRVVDYSAASYYARNIFIGLLAYHFHAGKLINRTLFWLQLGFSFLSCAFLLGCEYWVSRFHDSAKFAIDDSANKFASVFGAYTSTLISFPMIILNLFFIATK